MSTVTSSFARSVWLVAQREIGSKLRSKAFLISTGILFVIALAGVIWGGISAHSDADSAPDKVAVAVTTDAAHLVSDMPGLAVTDVPTKDAADALVRKGTVEAAIVGDASSPVGFVIVAKQTAPDGLVGALSKAPPVQLLEPETTNPVLRYIVALGFGLLFMISAQLFGSTIAQSVVEEKQTRVVELLISAIPTRALLAGKVLGNTILAMGQIIVLVGIAMIGMAVSKQGAVLSALQAPLISFAVFFLFGFILLAALFAAGGAMVSRQEDIGSTTSPIIFLIMIPYFLVIFFNDNPAVLTAMSYVPFSAPVGMPMRIFLGQAQWWEPPLSLVILIATCAAAIWVGSKIYDNSILRMGQRVSLKDALAR